MLATLGRALVRHGGQTGGPSERVEARISGDDAEPLRGLFLTGLDDLASPTRRRALSSRCSHVRHLMPKFTNHSTDHDKPLPVAGT